MLKLPAFAIVLGLLSFLFLNSCEADDIKKPEETSIIDGDDEPVGDDDDDSPNGGDDDTPGEDDDTPGEDDNTPGEDDDTPEEEDDDDTSVGKTYPYISEVGLQIFDGEDPLSDATPIFSYTNSNSVVLNPSRSCQLKIATEESSAWELNLLVFEPSVVTNNKCFNTSFVIKASDFTRSSWRVRLFQPGPWAPSDKFSTLNWDGSQGSINITPTSSLYTDPDYGDLPKRVMFTFNNVRVGYWAEDGSKKSYRIHGVIEVTKHD